MFEVIIAENCNDAQTICKSLFPVIKSKKRGNDIPLDRIVIETDASFILPYCMDTLPPKRLRRTRNTSMILPEGIKKIAELKAIPAEMLEQTTTKNVIRVFNLPL